MRSLDRWAGPVLILAWCGALGWAASAYGAVADQSDSLDVRGDPAGGVRATAEVVFPAPVHVVQSILTSYLEWPTLFDTKMNVASLSIDQGIATTDLRISHALLPGERRLVCESRTLPDGGLVTELKEGDFKRYHRVWKLRPLDNGGRTIADFELLVEIETMVPDWLVAMAIKQELATHFRIVKEKSLARAKGEN
jgi:hypothetical protein